MIGKIDPATRGLQVWVKEVYDCRGNRLPLETPGTNMKIYWAGTSPPRSPTAGIICTAPSAARSTT